MPELQNDDDAATDHGRLVRPLHSNTRMPRLRLRWHGRACRPDEIISHKRVASRSTTGAHVSQPQSRRPGVGNLVGKYSSLMRDYPQGRRRVAEVDHIAGLDFDVHRHARSVRGRNAVQSENEVAGGRATHCGVTFRGWPLPGLWCAAISPPQCTIIHACSGPVFFSALLLASRSGLQRISSTIGVSGRHSLPVFRPRSVKNSRALRRSRATGTHSGTYCIIS
jgi:hypothetical protein